MKRRLMATVLAVVAVASGLGAVAAAQEDTRPDLRVRLQFSGPGQWDPAFIQIAPDEFVAYNIFNRLVRFRPGSAELENDLAEDWSVSEDGLTYTFHLRHGVQFHDGYGELTAEDVKFSYDRLRDPATASPAAAGWAAVQEIVAVDPYTVEIHMSEPNATFPSSELAHRYAFVVPRAALEEMGAEAFGQHPVGSGPYRFVRRTAADEVVVEAFDDYFEGPPPARSITFVPITEETVAANALEAGEIDLIWTRGNAEVVEALKANPEVSTADVLTSTTRFLGFNPSYEPLKDPRVRRALAMAIDRDLIEAATGGLERAAQGPLSPQYGDWVDPDLPQVEYDPEGAKALLAEAGYPNLSFRFLHSLRSPDQIFADIMVEQWRAIGLDVERDGRDHAGYTAARNAGDYDVTITGLGRPLEPLIVFQDAFHTSSFPPGANIGYYTEVDDLIAQARTTFDDDARRRIVYEIQERIMEDLPVLPLTYSQLVVAWRSPIASITNGATNDFFGYTIVTDR